MNFEVAVAMANFFTGTKECDIHLQIGGNLCFFGKGYAYHTLTYTKRRHQTTMHGRGLIEKMLRILTPSSII